MSIYTTNLDVFQGDPGNPPAYASDDSTACAQCDYLIDLDDERYVKMADGTLLCDECRLPCQNCGMWVTDLSTVIWLRCPAIGRREPYCNHECAAREWLGRLIEHCAHSEPDMVRADRFWRMDAETIGREQIATLQAVYSRAKE